MLQPVVPYAIVGLALGSLMKRPWTGAILGGLVGTAKVTKRPRGQLSGFGDYGLSLMGVDMTNAPTVAPTIAKAKLAAGYAYKVADPDENEGWSPQRIATGWSGAPWNRHSSPTAILRSAQRAIQGKRGYKQANYYLSKVKKKTQKLPLSKREFKWKYRHEPKSDGPISTSKFASYFERKTGKKLKKRRGRTPVQGRRDDTSSYISASGPIDGEDGGKWYTTTGGKVGIAALAGTGALVLILMLTRR